MSLSEFVLRELGRVVAAPPLAEVLARAADRSTTLEMADIVAAVRAGRDTRS